MASRSISAVIGLLVAATLGAQAPAERPRPDASQRAAERLRALQREAETLATEENTLLTDLRRLEVQRALQTEELAGIDRRLRETQAKLAATGARAAALRDAADTERPDVEARLVQLYKLGRGGYWRMLLDMDDLRSVGRAYRTASAMTRIDRERVQQHQRTLEGLARERADLETQARDVTALQARATSARAAIDRAVAARTALVASIDARRDLNAQLTGELEAAQQRLQAAVAQLGSAKSAGVTLPVRPFRGALPWPAQGILTGRFGRERSTRFGAGTGRPGIDISLAEGRDVRAVHEGVVAFADRFTGYGNLVILDHGDSVLSLYGYLGSVEVAKGDRVDAQAVLGLSGRNPGGNPSLYFEIRVDGKPVDPLQWLKKPL
jgi:septal ring factor EnvC (AmiA/AmiB activator)